MCGILFIGEPLNLEKEILDMKKEFERVELEVVELEVQDVITTSDTTEEDWWSNRRNVTVF